MKGMIYKGIRLMPGSRALELYEEARKSGKTADWKKLDAHMADVAAAAKQRGEFA